MPVSPTGPARTDARFLAPKRSSPCALYPQQPHHPERITFLDQLEILGLTNCWRRTLWVFFWTAARGLCLRRSDFCTLDAGAGSTLRMRISMSWLMPSISLSQCGVPEGSDDDVTYADFCGPDRP
jgi:hypothetical protein